MTDMSNPVEVVRNQEALSEEETLLNNLATQIHSTHDIVQQLSHHESRQDRIVCFMDPLVFDVNPRAYRANFVIVGPFGRYDNIVDHFETQKRVYLGSFLQRAEGKASLKDFCRLIKDRADQIYYCYERAYQRTWNFPSNKIEQRVLGCGGASELFVEMILVDATFIIELFLRVNEKKGRYEKGDIYLRDLLLAQNQLPMFILKGLYELAFADANPATYPSFIKLTCHFFGPYYNQNISIDDIINSHPEYKAKLESAKHFTDLLRMLQLPYPSHKDSANQKPFRSRCIRNRTETENSEESVESGRVQGEYLYSAVLLREAGVKFKVSTSRCLLDIEFNEKNGELRIPQLRVDGCTEPFFRNLIAWEQHHYSHETYISDYIFLMEYLIRTPEDVDLLVRKRIIINQLGSSPAVMLLFNNFIKHVPQVEKNGYSDTFKKLNRYNAVRGHSWIAILRLQYFSTLWRGVATVAAILLLMLTLVQTICALISL